MEEIYCTSKLATPAFEQTTRINRTMRWTFSILLLIALTAFSAGNNSTFPVDEPLYDPVFGEKMRQVMLERKSTRFELGRTRLGQSVEAWYFPGTSNKNALVIGGVHGSELSSIEVVHELVKRLSNGDSIYYNTIIIPCLFPDNASIAKKQLHEIGSTKNIGRYSFPGAADPNRQMPAPGHPPDEEQEQDHAGRKVERENLLLLQLIQELKPVRIASVHAIRNKAFAGFFADPRTDANGIALGYETDSTLAVNMAFHVFNKGGYVPGNKLDLEPTTVYYKDPSPAPKGDWQPRNFTGSPAQGYKGSGVSLGTWASTAVKDSLYPSNDRDAISIITIEFPGSRRPEDYPTSLQKTSCRKQVVAYASAIHEVFLQ